MAVTLPIQDLLGENGAYLMDAAFGYGPQFNQGAVTGTVTFNPNATLGGGFNAVGTILFTLTGGSITGAIISAGARERQRLILVNEHATNTCTFAAVGTSNVLGGVGVVLPGNSVTEFFYDNNLAQWIPVGQITFNPTFGIVTATTATISGAVTAATVVASTSVQTPLYKNGAAVTEAYTATVSIDSTKSLHRIAGANGTSATSTFNASTTGADGDELTIEVTSTAAGTCTITFGTNFKSSGTLAVTASHYASVYFISDGTNWKEQGRSAIITS